ncbi:tetratricopeptide repeat protein [Fimbriimonas ginsengisoli]|uniref:Tetratricopeptide repeat-containing protein n=1 Tax=Fimbriimonas ginsengisoli Gsoil 348 TaxID=661478 RepID=A0A068NY16_FIMGI|nr:tetratricopeptide repeat protein [Fimbriimonas ginsengisoli]AIE87765.1 tetratricopeptide repeat-containing protein [Fimbriimonas ginsengisoli Gsoil 348]
MNSAADHARALIIVGRHADALPLLGQAIAQSPADSELYGLQALCLSNVGNQKEAVKQAQTAVSITPEWSWVHYVMGLVLQRVNARNAEKASRHAIALDPDMPHYYGLLAHVLALQGFWNESLQAAEIGLELDPDEEDCQSARSQALTFLGRSDEAREYARRTVSQNPDSADAHADMGWTSIRVGDRGAAVEHFKEALRIEPDLAHAQSGLLVALRSAFPPYRWTFTFANHVARLPLQFRSLVFVGLYFVARISAGVLSTHPALWPVLAPILVVTGFLVFMAFFEEPITDVVLLFHPLGRLAIGRSRRIQGWVLFAFLAIGLIWIPVSLIRHDSGIVPGIAVAGFLIAGVTYKIKSSPGLHKFAFWTIVVLFGLMLSLFIFTGDPPSPASSS